uniref:Hexose transporter 1 n=1 Tax=Aureoumbra lagunensis TaxID=44058 RepID=A0A7S3NJ67_9STRA|mmetsp:Transcript_9028/g.13895  ORF Transcript_9028/g.13895 Transcript_9028/m.13895 type:complete len:572 (-) Transcript_9028:124-1839(-)
MVSPTLSWELVLLSSVSCIGGFLFGYDTGVVSGCVIFLQKSLDLNSSMVEVVVSSTVGMAAVGAAVSGKPLQIFGRKPVIAISSVFYALGSSLIAFAPGIITIITGRLLLGLGVGLSSMAIPPYISEAAPIRIRGRLVSMYNLSIVVGQAIACGINILCENLLIGSMRWRLAMGIAAIPALIQFICFLKLPESPRFLIMKGQKKKAEQVLRRLRGIYDPNAPNTTEIHDFLRDTEADSNHESDSLQAALQKVKNSTTIQRIFRLGLGLMLLQQLSGINTVMYYGADILIQAGFPEHQSVALTAALAIAQGIGIISASPLFDKFGRRKLLIPSTFAAALSLVILGFAFITHTSWLSLIGCFSYLLSFGFGLSSGPWIVNAEVYPTTLRGLGVSSSTTVNWLANYLVSATFLTACNKVGEPATFFALAIIAFTGAFWLYLALPETAGQALSDHQLLALFDASSLLDRTKKRKNRRRGRRGPGAYSGVAQHDDNEHDEANYGNDEEGEQSPTSNPIRRRENFMEAGAAPLPAPVRPISSSSLNLDAPLRNRTRIASSETSNRTAEEFDDHPDGV